MHSTLPKWQPRNQNDQRQVPICSLDVVMCGRCDLVARLSQQGSIRCGRTVLGIEAALVTLRLIRKAKYSTPTARRRRESF